MSSTIRSSYKESSTYSSENFGNEASNTSAKDTQGSVDSIPRSSLQIQTPMALVRSSTHPQLPNIQPHQHATLFYLSLIEGRCRTQAANALNAGRPGDDQLPEDHPDVQSLSQHLFREMVRAPGFVTAIT
jgi:translation initiation factor 2-alpha kinase 3